VVPDAMGMHLVMEEAKGPRFPSPIRNREQIDALPIPDPLKRLNYVMLAIEETKRRLQGRVPIIGFSGRPVDACRIHD